MKHCLPPKCSASPWDVSHIHGVCINVQVTLDIGNCLIIVDKSALNIVEFEIKHGSSNLVNAGKLILVMYVLVVLE